MAVGEHAEKIIKDWLERSDFTIVDCRCDKEYQEKEIDYKIVVNDTFVTAEIKSDYHLGETDNVLFEVLRINHTASPEHAMKIGWSARTEADRLLFYAPQSNKIYKISTDDYRKTMQEYTEEVRAETSITFVETDNIKSTINFLIPMEYFKDRFEVFDPELTYNEQKEKAT
jgi:hypothetical protein